MSGAAARPGEGKWLRAVELAGWAALLAPLGVLLHELGHFLAARALGFSDAALKTASMSGGARLGSAPDWMVAVQTSAGPLVSIVLTAIAISYVRRDKAPLWAIALAATAPLRFLVGTVYLGVVLVLAVTGGSGGGGNFDEFNAARALALPVEPIVLVELAILALAWWSVLRIGLSGWRWTGLLALAAGTAAGLALWLGWLGPALLGG